MNGRKALAVALGLAMSAEVTAQIIEDASMNTDVNSSGSTWTISGGTVIGNPGNENQFHSFSQFDLADLETADFTGPAGIQNIVSRIYNPQSMGIPSMIDGTIRSSINGANLWIINPDGVVFGSTSSLSISGSLHVSSADYLLLEGGGQFYANPAANSILTVGSPSTFGFLGEPTGNIELDGAQLVAPDGETVSLVGRQVEIYNRAALTASGGRLNLVSVGSAGEVALVADGIDNSNISYDGDESVFMSGETTLDVEGEGGGSIYIRGGEFSMNGDETIIADTLGATDGGVVDIDVEGNVDVQVITANTYGSGAGGDISITGQNFNFPVRGGGIGGQGLVETLAESSGNAGSISLTAAGNISLDATLRVATESTGDAGDVNITAGSLNMNALGEITSSTRGEGAGAGGDINIDVQGLIDWQAGQIRAGTSVLNGEDPALGGPAGNITITTETFEVESADGFSISTATSTGGVGGDILLEAESDISIDRGTISSSATSGGDGGSVTLRSLTGSITLQQNIDGESVDIFATASDTGNAGSLVIEADTINLWGQASVSARTTGAGNAGDIVITAAELFDMVAPASIDSRSMGNSSGSAGTITVMAGDVSIQNGAAISVSTQSNDIDNTAGEIDIRGTRSVTINNSLGNITLSATTTGASAGGNILVSGQVVSVTDSRILSTTDAAGNAGSIALSGGDITVDGGTDLIANTFGTAQAGNISINGDNVNVLTAFVEAAAGQNGTGGNIDFSASNQLHLGDAANVIATTQGAGAGGTITLDSPDTIVDGQAIVSAETRSDGPGGSVQIFGGNMRVTGDASLLATTSDNGQGGIVLVDNTNVVVEGNGLISANTSSAGAGGTVDITSDNILVHENGVISADASATGEGGDIVIDAGETSVMVGGTISASTIGSATGGDIEISGGLLTVAGGGRIEATTTGGGDGGSIRIITDEVMLDPGGLVTVNAANAGDAGAIDINAGEAVFMDNARIESTSESSNGGDISIDAGELIRIRDSEIFASGADLDSGSPGNAGDIRLGMDRQPDSPAFLLFEGAHVSADAGGSGGAINVFAQYMLGADYFFDALSETGNDGEITINVPATDLLSVISQLELPILNVADLLDDQCAVSALSDRSSFVINTVGLPPSPEDYRSSSYYLPAARPAASMSELGTTYVGNIFKRPGC